MAPRTQWVNLPEASSSVRDRTRFKGEGVEGVDFMGREVVIEAELDQKDAFTTVKLEVTPDPGNAAYFPEEATFKAEQSKIGLVDKDGKAMFVVRLSAAGGDRFKLKVIDDEGTEKDLGEVETARKLYYQVIHMKKPSGPGTLGISKYEFLHQELLDAKRAIHLVEIPSKGDADHTYYFNNDTASHSRLFALAKAKYSEEKDPYCFAVVFADCLVDGPVPISRFSENVSRGKGEIRILLEANGDDYQLWSTVDKSPNAVWKRRVEFVYDVHGVRHAFPIPDGDIVGTYRSLRISTAHLPEGVTGRIEADVFAANGFYGGWSFNERNVIVIGTRSWWDQPNEEDKIRAVVVHETGHKIGIVPNGDPGGLRAQSTLDHQFDPARRSHCTDQGCTMWWTTAYRKDHYCAACATSVRKVELTSHRLPGFKRFY